LTLPLRSNTFFAGFLIAFIGAVLFSTKAIIVKLAFAGVHADPLSLLALRMLFSLPFYLVAAFMVSSKKENRRMNQKEWFYTILLGLFGYYLSSLFDFIGLQYISAGLERLILFLYPSFAVLIGAFVFKEQIHRNQLIALVLTYIGIGIAYVGELNIDSNNSNFSKGALLIFLCSITYAIFIAGSGKMVKKTGATKFTAYAMLSSTSGVLIHYLVAVKLTTSDQADHASGIHQLHDLWTYGLLLALIATVIPTFMISFAMKKIGASNVAIISSIGPVSTILQAHYFLGEPIFTSQIIGTCLVLCGVLLLSAGKKTGVTVTSNST
jgi:drug/metabolite transporter (DMT)-like permease